MGNVLIILSGLGLMLIVFSQHSFMPDGYGDVGMMLNIVLLSIVFKYSAVKLPNRGIW